MITLHHCPQSRSMRTLWLLGELGIEHRVIVHPFDKSLRKPAFLAVSPAGRVPALEIDGTCMTETGAITEYLCERFSADEMGRRPGHGERKDWLVWVHFAETISQHAAALTQQHVVLYEDHMRSPIVMKLEAARLGKCYDAIEGHLSAEGHYGDYFLASGFSAADVSVGQAVYMARHFAPLDHHPATARWYALITERAAFLASQPAEGDSLYDQEFYPAWEG